MKVVAVVPMKLNNQRLPNKNIKSFTNGKPLCTYILNTLLAIETINEVYVFCSDERIKEYLPEGVRYMSRPVELDTDTASMTDVLTTFSSKVFADVYVMTHTTAPFIKSESIENGIEAILTGKYDSAFAAKKVQDFIWKDGEPFNYSLDRIPRTQDLEPLYMETSGFYAYRAEVMTQLHRRIGNKPYIVEVGEIESIDIDEYEDFAIADAVYNYYLNEE